MRFFSGIAMTLLLLGAGCAAAPSDDSATGTPRTDEKVVEEKAAEVKPVEEKAAAATLDERLGRYLAEREICAAARLKELAGTPQEGENYGAEYHCTVKVMAPKYYKEDPEGITELCVRLYQVSGWTKEGGYLAGLTREELQTRHDLGVQLGVTMDDAGQVRYDEGTSRGWRDTCRRLIEYNID